jgi:hypothetical protein
MPNNPDQSFIHGYAGVMRPEHVVNYTTGPNMTDVDPGYVAVPVPGFLRAAYRNGRQTVDHPGVRGTSVVEIVTGAAGSARMLLALRDEYDSSFLYSAEISLDDQNRPEARIIANGTTVAEWTAGGAAIGEGVPLQLKLTWDAEAGTFTFTYLDGSAVGGSLTTAPAGPWSMSRLLHMMAGWAPTFGDFNGSTNALQCGISL